MVGWHHKFNGHEFEQTPGDSEGWGGLGCCGPWGRKESGITRRLKNNITVPRRQMKRNTVSGRYTVLRIQYLNKFSIAGGNC